VDFSSNGVLQQTQPVATLNKDEIRSGSVCVVELMLDGLETRLLPSSDIISTRG